MGVNESGTLPRHSRLHPGHRVQSRSVLRKLSSITERLNILAGSLAVRVQGLAADGSGDRAGSALPECHRAGDVHLADARRIRAVGDRPGFGTGHAHQLAGGDVNRGVKDDAGVAIDDKIRSADGAVDGHGRNVSINLTAVAASEVSRKVAGDGDGATTVAGEGARRAVLGSRTRWAGGSNAGNGGGEALLHLGADGCCLSLREDLGTLRTAAAGGGEEETSRSENNRTRREVLIIQHTHLTPVAYVRTRFKGIGSVGRN